MAESYALIASLIFVMVDMIAAWFLVPPRISPTLALDWSSAKLSHTFAMSTKISYKSRYFPEASCMSTPVLANNSSLYLEKPPARSSVDSPISSSSFVALLIRAETVFHTVPVFAAFCSEALVAANSAAVFSKLVFDAFIEAPPRSNACINSSADIAYF